MIRKPLFLSAVFAVAAFLALAPFAHAGFGITPPYVRNDRLTQGSSFTQKIILVRGDPVEDLKAELTFNIPEIEDWITVDRGSVFLLPKGERQVPINITVTVPPNAPFQSYEGNIRIKTSSLDPASGVSLALGAQVDVDLRVVDEILDFEVRRVQISEAEEPKRFWWLDYPGKISFTMSIANTGNAPVAPSSVRFKIYDKRGTALLEEVTNTNWLAPVEPFGVADVVAHVPTRLPAGAYLVKYEILHLDEEVKRQGELTLSVLPHGTLAAYVGYGFEGLSTGDKLSIVIPAALVLLVLIAASFVTAARSRRARRPRRQRPESDEDDFDAPAAPRRAAAPVRSRPAATVVDLSRRKVR
jgi:hypothetical protein